MNIKTKIITLCLGLSVATICIPGSPSSTIELPVATASTATTLIDKSGGIIDSLKNIELSQVNMGVKIGLLSTIGAYCAYRFFKTVTGRRRENDESLLPEICCVPEIVTTTVVGLYAFKKLYSFLP